MKIAKLLLILPSFLLVTSCTWLDGTYHTHHCHAGKTHVCHHKHPNGYHGHTQSTTTTTGYSAHTQQQVPSTGAYRGYDPMTSNQTIKKPHAIVYKNKDGTKAMPNDDGSYGSNVTSGK